MIGCDFDGTVYYGNSSVDFFFFCAGYKKSIYKYTLKNVGLYIKMLIGKITYTEATHTFFNFLKEFENPIEMVEKFWDKKLKKKIKHWFYQLDMSEVVMITASPSFLMNALQKRIPFKHCISTDIDINTGKMLTLNNTGEEKLRRYKKEFGDTPLDEFFSDSIKDLPMLKYAQKAYRVKGDRVTPWIFSK